MLEAHSYEEIRDVVIDILLQKEKVRHDTHINEFSALVLAVGWVFAKRAAAEQGEKFDPGRDYYPHRADSELIRDVFWDLFRQGHLTLGSNDANQMWPWFRLSYFGRNTLGSGGPYRFHDTKSFIDMV